MDLGLYDQAIWGFSKFNLVNETVYLRNFNALGDHFEPILAVVSPIYWIFNNVNAILIVQAIIVSSTIWPIYLLAKNKLNNQVASFLIAFSFIIFIGVLKAIGFDIHPVALSAPIIAWIIFAIEMDRKKLFYFMIFLLLLIKESTALYVIFIGIYAICTKKYKIGFVAVISGIIWYPLVINLLIPQISGAPYIYLSMFHGLGDSNIEILKTIITNPVYVLHIMVTPIAKIDNLLSLFGSVGFLSFLNPLSLIMTLPMLGEKYLTMDRSVNWVMAYQYNISIAPIIFFSAIMGIKKLSEKTKIKNMVIYGTILIFLSSLFITFIYYRGNEMYSLLKKSTYTFSTHEQSLYSIIDNIPSTASVTTQDHILPHLSHRYEIYRLGMNTSIQSDYVLIDTNLDGWPYTQDQLKDFVKFYLSNNDYKIAKSEDGIFLFRKN
jgi:uncharacterized membrane protein